MLSRSLSLGNCLTLLVTLMNKVVCWSMAKGKSWSFFLKKEAFSCPFCSSTPPLCSYISHFSLSHFVLICVSLCFFVPYTDVLGISLFRKIIVNSNNLLRKHMIMIKDCKILSKEEGKYSLSGVLLLAPLKNHKIVLLLSSSADNL